MDGPAPHRSAKPPTPKSARGGAAQKRGARGGARKSAAPCVSSRNEEDEHFPEHFPKHPVSGRHLPEHSPEHFWGGRGFCTSVGGRPVRNLILATYMLSKTSSYSVQLINARADHYSLGLAHHSQNQAGRFQNQTFHHVAVDGICRVPNHCE